MRDPVESHAVESHDRRASPATWRRLKETAGWIPFAGALLYGLLYLPYGLFYARLGTSPSEIGLSQPEIIGQSIGGLAAALLLPMWILGLPTAAVWAMAEIWPRYRSFFERWRHTGLRLLVAAWVVAAVVMLPAVSFLQAQSARDGHPPWVADVALLGLRADPVHLAWISSSPKPDIVDSETLLFLGAGNGQAILFDYAVGEPVRIPIDAVVLTVDS